MSREELRLQMFALVEQWEKSGQSQISFCNQQQLALVKFRYWIKKYNSATSITENNFIRLKPDYPPTIEKTEVVFPNGVKIVLPVSPDLVYLRKLISCW
jgi:hypothetical protein